MKYYHVWFQTKRRKRILLGEIDNQIHELFPKIAEEKGYNLIAFETMIDHTHLLLGLTEEQELSVVIKMFKGITARRMFQEFPMLKFQIRSNNFWARRFEAKEVAPRNLAIVIQYINDQKKDFGGL